MRGKRKRVMALLLAVVTAFSGCASDYSFYADEATGFHHLPFSLVCTFGMSVLKKE